MTLKLKTGEKSSTIKFKVIEVFDNKGKSSTVPYDPSIHGIDAPFIEKSVSFAEDVFYEHPDVTLDVNTAMEMNIKNNNLAHKKYTYAISKPIDAGKLGDELSTALGLNLVGKHAATPELHGFVYTINNASFSIIEVWLYSQDEDKTARLPPFNNYHFRKHATHNTDHRAIIKTVCDSHRP